MITYRLSALESRAQRHPKGRAAKLLAAGTVAGDVVHIPDADHTAVLSRLPYPVPERLALTQLMSSNALRPEGFREYALAHGSVVDDHVVLRESVRDDLNRLFYGRSRAACSPDWQDSAQTIDEAIRRVVGLGVPTVDPPTEGLRRAIFERCQHSVADGRCKLTKCD